MQHEKLSFPDAIRWLGKKYNIDVDDAPANFTPPPPRPKPIPLPTLGIPREIVKKTMYYTQRNHFCNWVRQLPWRTDEERNRIEQVLWMYCVGRWHDGRVVFWQIDELGNVRSGKLMRYLPDGHRDKKSNPGWIHNQKSIRKLIDSDHTEFHSTLFGMHLTTKYPVAKIHLRYQRTGYRHQRLVWNGKRKSNRHQPADESLGHNHPQLADESMGQARKDVKGQVIDI
jgi:hypothetical protein